MSDRRSRCLMTETACQQRRPPLPAGRRVRDERLTRTSHTRTAFLMSATTTVDIGGIAVNFPFQPYGIQQDYMKKVISCCQLGEHGLLESPTGTGKTLSLLCASLAWLTGENRKWKIADMKAKAKVNQQRAGGGDQESASQSDANEAAAPLPKYKVIYTARTHKQLSQAMGEMKRTDYAEKLTAVCLASRNEYCLNEDVRSLSTLTEKNQSCAEKRRCKTLDKCCKYFRPPEPGHRIGDYSNVISSLQSVSLNDDVPVRCAVIDVENMIEAGCRKSGCAYYAAQFAASTDNEAAAADVVFAPYNYIFNTAITLSVHNTVIIFDEGHNIEQTCEDAGSADISTFTLMQCSKGLNKLADDNTPQTQQLMRKYDHMNQESLRKIADFAEELAAAITSRANAEERKYSSRNTTDICKPPITWFTGLLLGKLSVAGEVNLETGEKSSELLGTQRGVFRDISMFFAEAGYKIYLDGKNDGSKNFLSALNSFSDFLQNVFPASASPSDRTKYLTFMKDNYRVAISKLAIDPHSTVFPRPIGYKMDLFCLNPGVAIARLLRSGVRSIIITSGTLAPMDSFESELGIQFKHKLCNPHVIPADQLMIFSVRQHAEYILDGSFRATKFGTDYYKNMGLALIEYIRRIPKGVLCFFKSYANLNKSLEIWQESGFLSEINQQKKVFEEPRDKRDFKRVLDAYKKHIDSGSGAILVAVYRGKISEGLDLADDYCRGVIVIGLPFPNWTDPHVELKREYLDAKKDARLSKDKWYNNQMLRAVNQAVGRIVRHQNDYGVVLLIDSSYNQFLSGLSAWLTQFIRSPSECRAETFISFFKRNANRVTGAAAGPTSSAVKRITPDSTSGDDDVVLLSDSDDVQIDVSKVVSRPPQKKVFWSTPAPLRIAMPFEAFEAFEAPAKKLKTEQAEHPASPVPTSSAMLRIAGSEQENTEEEEFVFDDAFDEIPFPILQHPSTSSEVSEQAVPVTSVAEGEGTEADVVAHEPDTSLNSNRPAGDSGSVPRVRAAEMRGEGELLFPPAFSSTPERVSSQEFWDVGARFKEQLSDRVKELLGDRMSVIDDAISQYRQTSDVWTFISRVKSIRASVTSHCFLPLVQHLCDFMKFSSDVDQKVFIERCVVIPKSC